MRIVSWNVASLVRGLVMGTTVAAASRVQPVRAACRQPHPNLRAPQPPTARNIQLAHGSLAAFFRGYLGGDVLCLQEVKLSGEKVTKELACVDGFEVGGRGNWLEWPCRGWGAGSLARARQAAVPGDAQGSLQRRARGPSPGKRASGRKALKRGPSPRPFPLVQSFWATSEERKGYSGVTTWAAAPDWRPEGAEMDCLGCREGRIVLTDHGPFAIVNV
jgi:exonuclease III